MIYKVQIRKRKIEQQEFISESFAPDAQSYVSD
jgi:hypothetical protein